MAIAQWSTLLAMEAGAAATLTGLVFVAPSANLSEIVAYPGLRTGPTSRFCHFSKCFSSVTVALVPKQSDRTFAIELIGIGFSLWFVQVVGQARYLAQRKGHPWMWFVPRALMSQMATIPFCVPGVELFFAAP